MPTSAVSHLRVPKNERDEAGGLKYIASSLLHRIKASPERQFPRCRHRRLQTAV